MSNKKNERVSFLDIWGRVKESTDLKTLVQLAEFTETSHPTVSRKKKENSFPVDWAFKIASQYGLNTDWIMTGEGAKRPGEDSKPQEEVFGGSLAEWLKERCQENPNFYREFMVDCAAFFPEYAEWLKKRKAGIEGDIPHQKIA